ncbi:putative amidohydrolase [Actinoplanes missouriensis 431]|uniref:Putative amidohydrolase n=1 Tax=Actinoplanes missouriensis (strain ATCC 14538 / DSM 43046 / CBS 188.64 / JCM 3121 / NBRC 102363 / NCIMB 12654 / NRRL B-3342 / UNCC 431) TaxID=512565 RepID=I0HD76_ACTM4|nr:dihydroorotase family protein [Actinoplanes missouriensis]BAL90963.1 putative amidohydrolase [Actinoplanes missouriensis 431]
MSRYDLLVRGGTLVVPYLGTVRADLATKDGTVAAIGSFTEDEAETILDATGKLVFPGAVDAHFHLGIYRDLSVDAAEETRSSLVGGATTVLSYFRTGQHYLNKTGPYGEIFPEVLDAVAGHAWTDYGFHLAPMDTAQVREVPSLVEGSGVSSFKYYMFYKGFNLSADSRDAKAFTMSDEYDLGHLYQLMEAVAAANAATDRRVSLSLHCEQAELMRLFIDRVRAGGDPQTLKAYSDARPPLTERVAIGEATTLAKATDCAINLLHLSSGEALAAAREARVAMPGVDMRFEVTLHHLCLSHDSLPGLGGKVNPPIRTAEDNEALWAGVLDGTVGWVASDHACCLEQEKGDELWPALPGFGGTALLYPILISEGMHKRGLSPARVAELVSANPARAYGLDGRKGNLLPGYDADLAVVDPDLEQEVTTDLLLSGQDHCPFEGRKVRGWPVATVLRGRIAYQNGAVTGTPRGAFVAR